MRYSLRREPWWNADRRARSVERAPCASAAVGDLRLSAFCLPSLTREEKSKWRVVDSEADFPNSRLAMDKTPTRIAL
jgi:hypothetical protein